jgi:hypothetical protein
MQLEVTMRPEDIVLFRDIGEARFGHLRNTKESNAVTVTSWVSQTLGRVMGVGKSSPEIGMLPVPPPPFFFFFFFFAESEAGYSSSNECAQLSAMRFLS